MNQSAVMPTATAQGGGSFWSGANTFLNDALNIWGKVEEIKATKSAGGYDQQQAMLQPELANGAGVQVDKNLQTPQESTGFKVDKRLLAFSGGILLLAVVMRKGGIA